MRYAICYSCPSRCMELQFMPSRRVHARCSEGRQDLRTNVQHNHAAVSRKKKKTGSHTPHNVRPAPVFWCSLLCPPSTTENQKKSDIWSTTALGANMVHSGGIPACLSCPTRWSHARQSIPHFLRMLFLLSSLTPSRSSLMSGTRYLREVLVVSEMLRHSACPMPVRYLWKRWPRLNSFQHSLLSPTCVFQAYP